MVMIYLIGLIACAVPTVAGLWFLFAFRDVQREIKAIRRYVQYFCEQTGGYRAP